VTATLRSRHDLPGMLRPSLDHMAWSGVTLPGVRWSGRVALLRGSAGATVQFQLGMPEGLGTLPTRGCDPVSVYPPTDYPAPRLRRGAATAP
jgi:hypothetical protein